MFLSILSISITPVDVHRILSQEAPHSSHKLVILKNQSKHLSSFVEVTFIKEIENMANICYAVSCVAIHLKYKS